MNIIKSDHISYSQTELYNTCPAKYWFNYLKYPEERKKAWDYRLGLAYHKAMESFYKNIGLQGGLDAFDEVLGAYTTDQVKERNIVRSSIEYYWENIYSQYYTRVRKDMVEIEDFVTIPGLDIPVKVVVDLVTIDDVIIDHKTTGWKEYAQVDKNRQLLLYSYWFLQKFKKLPKQIELHKCFKVEKTNKRPIEIESAAVNYVDVMKIVREVKAVGELILAGKFYPKVGKHCNYCYHKDNCDKVIQGGFEYI